MEAMFLTFFVRRYPSLFFLRGAFFMSVTAACTLRKHIYCTLDNRVRSALEWNASLGVSLLNSTTRELVLARFWTFESRLNSEP